jgi:hypothetical protein
MDLPLSHGFAFIQKWEESFGPCSLKCTAWTSSTDIRRRLLETEPETCIFNSYLMIALAVLRFEPRALRLLGKCSTTCFMPLTLLALVIFFR